VFIKQSDKAKYSYYTLSVKWNTISKTARGNGTFKLSYGTARTTGTMEER
jgi:hypothetical protein